MKKSRIAEALANIAQKQPPVIEEKRDQDIRSEPRAVDPPVRRPIRWIIRRHGGK